MKEHVNVECSRFQMKDEDVSGGRVGGIRNCIPILVGRSFATIKIGVEIFDVYFGPALRLSSLRYAEDIHKEHANRKTEWENVGMILLRTF